MNRRTDDYRDENLHLPLPGFHCKRIHSRASIIHQFILVFRIKAGLNCRFSCSAVFIRHGKHAVQPFLLARKPGIFHHWELERMPL